jgi:UDP-N-acetylglucosamine--N-acetylmuramyl-(pentapeptide) pyrophosphoryl-undecaprenol N-acetylglucosamine transferase
MKAGTLWLRCWPLMGTYAGSPTTLLVASTGGHLKELHHLRSRLSIDGPVRWVTFDTPQSRSLLAGERVDYVPFVGGRDPLNVARNLLAAARILREERVGTVVSTGSSMALPYFALARARRLRCHYIESAARLDGPSMTGRLMSRIPGVHLYTQYPKWAQGRWKYGGSVFDAFASDSPSREASLPRDASGSTSRDVSLRQDASGSTSRDPSLPQDASSSTSRDASLPQDASHPLRRVVVSLGTYRGYGFPRLVRRLLEILPADADVLWQTGDTDVSGFGIAGHYAIPEDRLIEAMRQADVVIAHAGVGTALAALEVGKCPLLVPRRVALGEHVDDHQVQIADELGSRGLALVIEADELDCDHLLAAARRVVAPARAPAFVTAGPQRTAPAGPSHAATAAGPSQAAAGGFPQAAAAGSSQAATAGPSRAAAAGSSQRGFR